MRVICVAGAVFGEVEILESHFAWQAQYVVSLDSDTCCSAHCK